MRECDLPLSVDGEFLVRIDWKGDELFCESMLVRASRIGLRIIRSGRPLGEFWPEGQVFETQKGIPQMRRRHNLMRFLAMLVVLTLCVALPRVVLMPSNVVLPSASSVVEPVKVTPCERRGSCFLPRAAQCNLYAFNANDQSLTVRRAAA